MARTALFGYCDGPVTGCVGFCCGSLHCKWLMGNVEGKAESGKRKGVPDPRREGCPDSGCRDFAVRELADRRSNPTRVVGISRRPPSLEASAFAPSFGATSRRDKAGGRHIGTFRFDKCSILRIVWMFEEGMMCARERRTAGNRGGPGCRRVAAWPVARPTGILTTDYADGHGFVGRLNPCYPRHPRSESHGRPRRPGFRSCPIAPNCSQLQ
jgi:hypothetical protein